MSLAGTFQERLSIPNIFGRAESAAPGTSNLSQENPFYSPLERVPKYWEPIIYSVDERKHVVYNIPANGETRGRALVLAGCGSDSRTYAKRIRALRNHGIHVFAARQVHKDEIKNHIGANLSYVRQLLLSEQSPIHAKSTSETPLFIDPHSSSMLPLDQTCFVPEYVHRLIGKGLDYIFANSAFYSTAKSFNPPDGRFSSLPERQVMKTVSWAFEQYAQGKPDITLGDDRISRFLGGNKTTAKVLFDIGTTYGQAIHYKQLGEGTVKHIERLYATKPDHPFFKVPVKYYAGESDPASSTAITRHVASMRDKADIEVVQAEHNPWKENEEVGKDMLRIMDLRINLWNQNEPKLQNSQLRRNL